jgi:hypothetical protein
MKDTPSFNQNFFTSSLVKPFLNFLFGAGDQTQGLAMLCTGSTTEITLSPRLFFLGNPTCCPQKGA